jgi:hypothetical protein
VADLLANAKTRLSGEDVIVRAVQFFTNESWRGQSQSPRVATFVGKPKLPWGLLFLTFLAFLCFVVPGLILYFLVIRKVYRFQNIVVATTPEAAGTDVTITYPKPASMLVRRFVEVLPPVGSPAVA